MSLLLLSLVLGLLMLKELGKLSIIFDLLLLLSLWLTQWRPRRVKLKSSSYLLESLCILLRPNLNVPTHPKDRTKESTDGRGRTAMT